MAQIPDVAGDQGASNLIESELTEYLHVEQSRATPVSARGAGWPGRERHRHRLSGCAWGGELAVAAKAWHHKASTAIDFKGMDLRVQDVVVNRTGRSGVLLNGEVYEEGDYISDDLLVKMVEEEQVWFVFRGLTLVRTM